MTGRKTKSVNMNDFVGDSRKTRGKQANGDFSRLKKLLPSNFKVQNGKVVKKSGDDCTEVCDAFDVIGLARTPQGSGWGIAAQYTDPDGKVRQTVISKAQVHGDTRSLRQSLVNEGFNIAPVAYHFEQLISELNPTNRVLLASTPGWHGPKLFICPDGATIGDHGAEQTFLSNPLTNQRSGTLEGQLGTIALAFDSGAEHYALAVLAGAAGCVAGFIGHDSTSILALTGPSSTGKTTAISLGGSIFGDPKLGKGLTHSLRSTDNALEIKASKSNGTFLGLDETAHFDPHKLEQLIFMVAAGTSKGRLKSSLQSGPMYTWTTVALLSSEHSVVDLIERTGRKARVGFTARCADIDMSEAGVLPILKYKQLKQLLRDNFGHAGPKLAEYLARQCDPREIEQLIDEKTEALTGAEASPLIQRSAALFGLLAATGCLLVKAGMLKSEALVDSLIQRTWKKYQSSTESASLDPIVQAMDTLRESLFARRGRDVHDMNEAQDKTMETAAWSETPTKPGEHFITFFVRSNKLSEFAGDTVKSKSLCKALEEERILIRADAKNRTHKTLPNGAPVSHYRLRYELSPEANIAEP